MEGHYNTIRRIGMEGDCNTILHLLERCCEHGYMASTILVGERHRTIAFLNVFLISQGQLLLKYNLYMTFPFCCPVLLPDILYSSQTSDVDVVCLRL